MTDFDIQEDGVVRKLKPALKSLKRSVGIAAPQPGHDELRDRYLATSPPILYTRLKFYRYDADLGVWSPIEDMLIEAEVLKMIERAKGENVRVTAPLLSSVTKLTKVKTAIDGARLDAEPDLLVCGNGTLHIPTRDLREYSPDHFATTRVAYNYDADAAAPAWDRYLIYATQTLGKETVDFLQEFIGYSLTTDTRHEIMVWLVGAKGSGKSTFIDGVTAALSDRRGTFSLKNLGGRFGLIHIPGKTLLTSTENTSTTALAQGEGILSTIVSGEEIHIEHKGRDEFTCNPVAKILWAMNRLPNLPETESGVFRRVNIVSFPRMPADIEVDPGLKERIKDEGAGILNWALDGLDRLTSRGRFLIPGAVKGATGDYQASCDTIGLFLTDKVDIDANGKVARSELYTAFNSYCREANIKPILSRPEANKALEQRFGPARKVQGEWYWFGCRLERDRDYEVTAEED